MHGHTARTRMHDCPLMWEIFSVGRSTRGDLERLWSHFAAHFGADWLCRNHWCSHLKTRKVHSVYLFFYKHDFAIHTCWHFIHSHKCCCQNHTTPSDYISVAIISVCTAECHHRTGAGCTTAHVLWLNTPFHSVSKCNLQPKSGNASIALWNRLGKAWGKQNFRSSY